VSVVRDDPDHVSGSGNDDAGPAVEPARSGPSRRRRLVDILIIMLVPLVLSGVALHQIHLATTGDLTPWKGGGFGMFSSPDRASHRAMRGSFEGEFGEVPVDMQSLTRRARGVDHKTFVNARALPDARRMDPMADMVRAAEWRIRNDVAVFSRWRDDTSADDGPIVWVQDGDERHAVRVDRFTIEVWGPRYSIDEKVIEPRLLAAHRYEVSGDPVGEVRP
jgi:hypothetical protein